jgi:hypothetical protein
LCLGAEPSKIDEWIAPRPAKKPGVAEFGGFMGSREPGTGNELQNPIEQQDEARRLRRLQVMIGMVMSVIGQDPHLTVEEASELAAGARRAALAMFPGKELAFDILYKPRLQRLLNERFRLQ